MADGWRYADFRECVEEIRSGKSVNSTEEPANADQVGVLKTSCVYNGSFDPRENKLVVPEEQSLVKCPVTAGTIIVSRMNTADLVGASGYVDRDYPNIFLPDRLWAIFPKQGIDPVWLYYVTSSPETRARLSDSASGTSASMKNMSQDVFLSMPARIPPLPEQRKIAEILRTWDEAIEKLEALRAAKERRITSVRQRLFEAAYASHNRLQRARDIFETVSERARPDLPLLAVMQDIGIVRRDELDRRVAMPDGDTLSYKVIRPGDFVISLRSFEGGLEYSTITGLVSPAYTVLRPNTQLVGEYYRHFFKSRSFIGRLDKLIFGIRDGKQIAFRDFGDMHIPAPPVSEQKTQSRALHALEVDLALEEKRIETLARQKRGLMQKLLTGEWRVKSGEGP
ncbi:restriction endonuclease subunit S [Prosthecomicrobium hirschii]|nr:restriction endonuclease subunit S [Prosthecomicrobium hirschii]